MHIVGVGLGAAGLAALDSLSNYSANNELSVSFFERASEAGGRFRTTLVAGKQVESGGEFIAENHIYIRNLASRYDVGTVELYSNPFNAPKMLVVQNGRDYPTLEFGYHILPFVVKAWRDLRRGNRDQNYAAKLKQVTISEYVDEVLESKSDIKEALLRLIRSRMGGDPSETSVWAAISEEGMGRSNYWLFKGCGKYMIDGGSKALCESILNRVKADIHFQETLVRISQGAQFITLEFESGRVKTADGLLVCTSPVPFRDALVTLDLPIPPKNREMLRMATMGHSEKVLMVFNGEPPQVLEDLTFISSDTAKGELWLQRSHHGKGYFAVTLYRSGLNGSSLNEEAVKAEIPCIIAELERICRCEFKSRLLGVGVTKWHSDPSIGGAFFAEAPGSNWDPDIMRNICGDLPIRFANEATCPVNDTEFVGGLEMGHIESAARAGVQAANELISNLNF